MEQPTITNEQVQAALRTGLELLSPASGIQIDVKHLDGAIFLRQILSEIARGKMQLSIVPPAPPPEVPEAPEAPEAPKEKGM